MVIDSNINGKAPSTESGSGTAVNVAKVMNQVFEGVCRPYKVRVEQVLASSPGMTLAYRLANLHKFYHNTFSAIVGNESTLSKVKKKTEEKVKCAKLHSR